MLAAKTESAAVFGNNHQMRPSWLGDSRPTMSSIAVAIMTIECTPNNDTTEIFDSERILVGMAASATMI
jgi:hypothetical protein